MEKQSNRSDEKDSSEKRVRFLNVINEGQRWFSFVVCPTETANVILYAWLDDLTGTTHTSIFDLAVVDHGFNEKYEPISGGAINTKTCEWHDSLHYGGVEDLKIEKAVRNKVNCESD